MKDESNWAVKKDVNEWGNLGSYLNLKCKIPNIQSWNLVHALFFGFIVNLQNNNIEKNVNFFNNWTTSMLTKYEFDQGRFFSHTNLRNSKHTCYLLSVINHSYRSHFFCWSIAGSIWTQKYSTSQSYCNRVTFNKF